MKKSEIKLKLSKLLSEIPLLDKSDERKAFLASTGVDNLTKFIKLEGSRYEFCNRLVELLIAKEVDDLLRFISNLCECHEIIGIKRKQELETLKNEIYKINSIPNNKSLTRKYTPEVVDKPNIKTPPKVIIQKYLEHIDQEIQNKYKYAQAIENYISLSGIRTQAYEEDFSRSTKLISNLDRYLISNNNSPPIVIYGSPGSGKSTTLHKTFTEYRRRIISSKEWKYIPIFLHANEIASILDVIKGKQKEEITSFLSIIYEKSNIQCIKDFLDLLWNNTFYKLVIIIDALDEFVDKTNRGKLFDFLSKILENTYKTGTKWMLSCREKEYKGFAYQLKVTNIRLKPLSPTQFEKLLRKNLKNRKTTRDLSDEVRKKIFRTLNNLREVNKQREIYLTNPYYLTLWIDFVSELNPNSDDYIPSINELHEQELKREYIKYMEIDKSKFYQKYPLLLNNTIKILSVLSFYTLEQSLKKDIHEGIPINDQELLERWIFPVQKIINDDDVDKITKKRLKRFSNISNISDFEYLNNSFQDHIFLEILKYFKKNILNNRIDFIIVLASIIEQSLKNNIIKFKNNDFKKILFDRFTNQRIGDYLAACYLKEGEDDRLSNILKSKEPNFWLSRSIAIAIASSKDPRIILEPLNIPQDYVFESAIVDGLILMQSKQKDSLTISTQKNVKPFIYRFITHLLNEERLNPQSKYYDVCAPLRLLSEMRRLIINGYCEKIEFPDDLFKKLISKYLKDHNIPVCRELYMTYFSYAYHSKFNINRFIFLTLNFLSLTNKFEFNNLYNDFKYIIKK